MARKQSKRTRRRVLRTILRLPDLEQAKTVVLNSLSSVDAQRWSRRAIDAFVEWHCSERRFSFHLSVALRFRMRRELRNLAPGTVHLHDDLARRLVCEATDCALLSPGSLRESAQRRLEGTRSALGKVVDDEPMDSTATGTLKWICAWCLCDDSADPAPASGCVRAVERETRKRLIAPGRLRRGFQEVCPSSADCAAE
jgi:hypothetical protein